ncbi:hypothetical protein [Actinoplanes sp. NPDC051494]|uniref:hypothetical protein n=1 Tax=Actinoplanes sp. NPDC051494 TaxID=3363907 RepID=UPI0037A911D9
MSITPSEPRVFAALGAWYLTGFMIFFAAGWVLWSPLRWVVVPVAAVGVARDWRRARARLIRDYQIKAFENFYKQHVEFVGPAGQPCQASGISVNDWVADKSVFEQQRRDHRLKNGRSAPDPPASYRRVVATFRVNGQAHKMAFADGEVFSSAPNLNMLKGTSALTMSSDSIVYRSVSEPACEALVVAVTILHEIRDVLTVREIEEAVRSDLRRHVTFAIRAAHVWGLIIIRDEMGDEVGSIHPDLGIGQFSARITDAGEIWYQCSDEARAKREKAAKVPRSFKIVNQAGSQANINYAEGDISGQTNNFYSRPTGVEVLDALALVLKHEELPWADRLEHVRPVLEQAVSSGDIDESGLRRAVRQLLEVSGAIVVGVMGNTVYDTLKAFVS